MLRYGPDVALLVVDVQNDFADPKGSLFVRGAPGIVAVVNEQVALARAAGSMVVCSQDWHPRHTPHFARDGGTWPVHCVAETWGAELHAGFEIPTGVPVVRKGSNGEDGYSAFTMRDASTGATVPTLLEPLLEMAGIGSVVIVGLATDYCVKATALDAVRLAFDTTVIREGIAPVDLQPGDGDRALEEMAAAGCKVVSAHLR